MIYLCLVKLCIKYGVFYIMPHKPIRWTMGPHALQTDIAQKSAHVSCLGRQANTMACGGMARWHDRPDRPMPYQAMPSTGSCHVEPAQPVAQL